MTKKVIQFLIFDEDELSGTLIENYLKDVKFPFEIYKFNKFDKSKIKNDDLFYKFIFINITKRDFDILDDISICSTNSKNIFFMMSSEPTTDLYIKVLRAGTKEFLRKPLEKDSFLAAVKNNYREEMIKDEKTKKRGAKIIAVTSLEKNCGKTFSAINIASELAYVVKDRVLLMDFNENLNNVTFSLNIDQKHDTHYYIDNITEENAGKILLEVYKYKDLPLYIMSSCMYKAQRNKILTADNFQNFLDIVKRYFRYIVIDVNNDIEITTKAIFGNTDMIFYLITPNIAANSRNKSHIDVNFDKKKFRIILNKYRDKDESRIGEIENILGREIFYKIPINLSVTMGAGSQGKTIREINATSDIAKKYNQLAKYIISRV
ncbi:MAG: CpaE family protein [Candidatus Avigastranaerophilus sp.]